MNFVTHLVPNKRIVFFLVTLKRYIFLLDTTYIATLTEEKLQALTP